MAGKFFNTSTVYEQMVNKAQTTMQGLTNNPYYLFTDKKATQVDYYNINTTQSTLDEATRGNYGEISAKSPVRFNEIPNFLLFGITKVEPNMDIGEFGLEASDITGEGIVLPNTIIPYPGDYFYITSLKNPYLFRVTSVNPNTLETGATLYRVQYSLQSSDGLKRIKSQVVKRLKFIYNAGGMGSEMGSNMSASLIDEDVYDLSSGLQDMATRLKDYYADLFYNNKVQTFTYDYNTTEEYKSNNGLPHRIHLVNMQKAVPVSPFGFKVYDPYLIEFIIRNGIMSGSSVYLYIEQQMYLPSTFGIDYDKTIFASLEDCDINKHYGRSVGNLIYCDQQLSLLYQHPQDYYYMQYHNLNAQFRYISIFDDPEFATRVKNQDYYPNAPLKNLIIKYFNGVDITVEDIEGLKHLDYTHTKEYFYGIPFAIFCIENQITKVLSSSATEDNEG